MKKLLIVLLSLTCLCSQCFHYPGCPDSSYVKITVVDKDDHPVSGASLVIMNQSNNIINTGQADVKGRYLYEHGSVGPHKEAVEVVADSPDNLHHGTAIIGIIPGDFLELTVVLD